MYQHAYRVYFQKQNEWGSSSLTLMGNSEEDIRRAWVGAHERTGNTAPEIIHIMREDGRILVRFGGSAVVFSSESEARYFMEWYGDILQDDCNWQ